MLDTLTTASGTIYTYKYDNQGFRRSKTVGGVTTQYVCNGDKLTYQTDGTTSLYFHYDGDNNITGFRYIKGRTNTEYYYVKNLQGDIIGILDGSGKVVVNYAYDAWGVCEVSGSLASTIGQINPIRYRGYYYDTESGLYYLMSRYYDAVVGRFINADDTLFFGLNGTVLSYNLFLYCDNNPIIKSDAEGYIAANVVGAVIGVIIGIVGGKYLGNWLADTIKLSGWKRTVFVSAVAAFVGAAAGTIGYFMGPYVAKIATKLGQYVANLISKGKIKFKNISTSEKKAIKSLLNVSCCFVEGTKIMTKNGHVDIEDIRPGDYVWAKNMETGEIGLKPVLQIFRN